MRVVLKIIIQIWKVIKILHIKFVFKIIENKLKTFQVHKQTFFLQIIIEQFLKTVFQNYFLK